MMDETNKKVIEILEERVQGILSPRWVKILSKFRPGAVLGTGPNVSRGDWYSLNSHTGERCLVVEDNLWRDYVPLSEEEASINSLTSIFASPALLLSEFDLYMDLYYRDMLAQNLKPDSGWVDIKPGLLQRAADPFEVTVGQLESYSFHTIETKNGLPLGLFDFPRMEEKI